MSRFFDMIPQRAATLVVAAATVMMLSTTVSAEEYTESQLKSYAMAWVSINELAEKWKSQIEAAESKDQANQMFQQFDVEVGQAIESTDGINVDEFQSIMAASKEDPALSSQIEGMMQEMSAN
jgi:hypothetical protein